MAINIACHNFDCIHNEETLCMLDVDNKTITINSHGKCEGYTTTRDIGSAKLKEAKLSFARLGLASNKRR